MSTGCLLGPDRKKMLICPERIDFLFDSGTRAVEIRAYLKIPLVQGQVNNEYSHGHPKKICPTRRQLIINSPKTKGFNKNC